MARAARRRDPEAATAPGFLLITGLSGAGRSEAARSLEDLGYFVVDNLPPALLPKMAELAASPGGPRQVAIVVDARGGVFFGELSQALEELREQRVPSRIVFLDASDEDLGQPVRGHPPPPPARAGRSGGGGDPEGTADDGEPARRRGPRDRHDGADAPRPPRPDRETFAEAPPEAGLLVSVVSFGFKYGSPRDADLVLDVRFLPNPHWVDELRPLPGTNEKVREYVEGQEEYGAFMERLEGAARRRRPRLRRRGQVVPDGRGRVHRRPPPVGRRRRGPRRLLPGARAPRVGEPPRRRPRLSADLPAAAASSVLILPSLHRRDNRPERWGRAAASRVVGRSSSQRPPAGPPPPRPRAPTRRPPLVGWRDRGVDEPRGRFSTMSVKVGINGFGRIGRNFLRAARADGRGPRLRRRERHHGREDARASPEVRLGPGPLRRRRRRSRTTGSPSTATSCACSPSGIPRSSRGRRSAPRS